MITKTNILGQLEVEPQTTVVLKKTMQTILSLSQNKIDEILEGAKNYVYWAAPAFTMETANKLINIAKRDIEVLIITDLNAQRFKNFEGDFEATEMLTNDQNIVVQRSNSLGFGLLIADGTGYAISQPMRAYEKDGERCNAIKLGASTTEQLGMLLFGSAYLRDPEIKETPEIKEERDRIKQVFNIEEATSEELSETRKEIEKNPPLKIDK